MEPLLEFICIFLTIYVIMILGWVVLSWLQLPFDHPIQPLKSFMQSIVAPYLDIFRGLVKPIQVGGAALDLSPIIGIFLIFIVRGILCG